MQRKRITQVLFCLSLGLNAWAHEGHVHVKHNMILFGEREIFASHIVYKVPHNFQVILSLSLSQEDREQYLAAKRAHPDEQFIFLLDPIDIATVASQEVISGIVFYLDADGTRHEVISNLRITAENFKLIYFDELPLSLSSKSVTHSCGENKNCSYPCRPGFLCQEGQCRPVF